MEKPNGGIIITAFGIAVLLGQMFSGEMRPLIEALYFEFIETSSLSVWFWVFPLAIYYHGCGARKVNYCAIVWVNDINSESLKRMNGYEMAG